MSASLSQLNSGIALEESTHQGLHNVKQNQRHGVGPGYKLKSNCWRKFGQEHLGVNAASLLSELRDITCFFQRRLRRPWLERTKAGCIEGTLLPSASFEHQPMPAANGNTAAGNGGVLLGIGRDQPTNVYMCGSVEPFDRACVVMVSLRLFERQL